MVTLNDAGVQAIADRAAELSEGRWSDRSDTAEVNLALTLAEIVPALR